MDSYQRQKVANALRGMGVSEDSSTVTRAITLVSNPQQITQADRDNGLGPQTIETISTVLKIKGRC